MKLAMIPKLTQGMIEGWCGPGPINEIRHWCEQELAKGTGYGFIIGVFPGPWENSHDAYTQALMALWDAGIRGYPVTTIPIPEDTCHMFWFPHDKIWNAFLILSKLPIWAPANPLPAPPRVAFQLGNVAPILVG